MYKREFIKALAEKADISEEQAFRVNEILEAHPFVGKNAKAAVVSEIEERLGFDTQTAESISNTASELIAGKLADRLIHPFGGNDEEK